jgi:MbtH protein
MTARRGSPMLADQSRLTKEREMNQLDATANHYVVVINEEEQYSIWRVDRTVPPGWSEIGVSGELDWCLDYIESVWTDMRPKTLRVQMDCSR